MLYGEWEEQSYASTDLPGPRSIQGPAQSLTLVLPTHGVTFIGLEAGWTSETAQLTSASGTLWEEMIARFLPVRHGPRRKQRVQQFFILTGESLPSYYVVAISGHTDRSIYIYIYIYTPRTFLILMSVLAAAGTCLPSNCKNIKGGSVYQTFALQKERGYRYDRRSVGQSVLVSATLGLANIFFKFPWKLYLDSWGIVIMGRPLRREDGYVLYGRWASPAQYFWGLSPAEIFTIFYFINF
jgi:hypothetical protein